MEIAGSGCTKVEKYTDEISLLAILSVLELYYNGPQDVDMSFPVFAVVI